MCTNWLNMWWKGTSFNASNAIFPWCFKHLNTCICINLVLWNHHIETRTTMEGGCVHSWIRKIDHAYVNFHRRKTWFTLGWIEHLFTLEVKDSKDKINIRCNFFTLAIILCKSPPQLHTKKKFTTSRLLPLWPPFK